MEASQAAQRIARALEESRDDVVNTLNSYVDHPANDRKRARIAQQLADHDAAIADARALLAERDELRKALGMIEWSNDSKWQADCARAALTKEAP